VTETEIKTEYGQDAINLVMRDYTERVWTRSEYGLCCDRGRWYGAEHNTDREDVLWNIINYGMPATGAYGFEVRQFDVPWNVTYDEDGAALEVHIHNVIKFTIASTECGEYTNIEFIGVSAEPVSQ
jgi:hypothetical protein